MKTRILFFAVLIAIAMSVSGCFVLPDKVSGKMGSLFATPPGYVPFDRIDVFNNIQGTYMVLSDRGGVKPEHIPTGDFGWVPQNTYFGADGYERINNNTITARFYDIASGEYLGLWHYQINGGSIGYEAIHSPYERKMLKQG